MKKKTYKSTGESIESFLDKILVICPRCELCAEITPANSQNSSIFAPRQLVCVHCGISKEWSGNAIRIGNYSDPPVDSYFDLPLFLAEPCCGHTLWAYNLRQLNVIEDYVSAALRQHEKSEKYGWNNRSIVSRLPRWIISAKNRDMVLKAIAKLKTKIQVVA